MQEIQDEMKAQEAQDKMKTQEVQDKLNAILFAGIQERLRELQPDETASEKRKPLLLAHYTSVAAALSILEHREIWMRSVKYMNDFTEMKYGMGVIKSVLGREGKVIKESLGKNKEAWKHAWQLFNDDFEKRYNGVYITCLSEHDAEDRRGKLSMWRGYGGGVAFVLKTDKFRSDFGKINVVSSPVEYWGTEEFRQYVVAMAAKIREQSSLFSDAAAINCGKDRNGKEMSLLGRSLYNMLVFGAICLKHPGFQEESEWRIISIDGGRPAEDSKSLTEDIETVNGIPQIVKKIPLTDKKESSSEGFSINENLAYLIVGPMPYKDDVANIFRRKLAEVAVENADEKVCVSDIPYRG